MTTFSEGRHPGEFILSEASFHRSRENVVVAVSQTLLAGTVLGRVAVVAGVVATAAADAGNTGGSGALTLANPAVSSRVKDGVYNVICTEPATNAGTFEVFDPSGKSIGKATVGVAFNKEVKFTIADATDFVSGDRFTITVEADADDYQYVAWNPTGTDGSEVVAGVAIYPLTTDGSNTAKTAIMRRSCEVKSPCLEWPAGVTAGQKADGIQGLEALGIIVR